MLQRGRIINDSDDRTFKANVRRSQWNALEPRRRREEADRIAKGLAGRGVKDAQIVHGKSAVVIRIDDGFVAYVEGGKL